VQRPHPPILIGGYGPAVINRVVTLGDGFIGGNVPLKEVAALAAQVREAAAAAGRDGAPLRLVRRGTVRLGESAQGEERRPLWGAMADVREEIRRYAEAGLDELFLDPNFDPAIGENPDAGSAMAGALAMLEAFAPGGDDA
jgi:alkanesulfonate monooxygenase SsuD/methylene tetrahydromethanopterin reductase-like flavin-dependent oxidoreductase (luciferase family)